jgi:putative phage-type endonuclease
MDLRKRAQTLIGATYAEQRSEEWLKLRENLLTASDVASAIGENRYESPDSLLKKKVLKTAWAGNAATAHGTLLEPVARDLYDAKYGRKSHELGLVLHPVYPFLGGSADGVTECGRLIEIKCPLTRKIEAKVPPYYLPQIQLLLEILDLEECDFIQYRPAAEEGGEPIFVVVVVKRDREWFAQRLAAMQAFWDRVIKARETGLCEITDDPVKFDPQFKKEIVCYVIDEPVQSQKQNPDVQGMQCEVLCEVHST